LKKTSRKNSCSIFLSHRDVQGVIYSRQWMTISQQKMFFGHPLTGPMNSFQAKVCEIAPHLNFIHSSIHSWRGFASCDLEPELHSVLPGQWKSWTL
jgi:hypothetical protein